MLYRTAMLQMTLGDLTLTPPSHPNFCSFRRLSYFCSWST